MAKTKVQLIIEKADGQLWGRVKVKDNLITHSVDNINALKKQLNNLFTILKM